ncbi:MAG: AEC family transporter [Candidatus Shapirobacteria bacterium]|nr:AEC family transporter [Candidatus Shapirobacteria bacterium]
MLNLPVFALFLIIFLGYLAKKVRIAQESWLVILNDFAFYIAFPALAFVGLVEAELAIIFQNPMMAYSLAGIVVFAGLIYWLVGLFSQDRGRKIIFALGSVFGNVAYLGVPVAEIAYPKEGLVGAVSISIIYLILVLTLGIFLLESYQKKLKPILLQC